MSLPRSLIFVASAVVFSTAVGCGESPPAAPDAGAASRRAAWLERAAPAAGLGEAAASGPGDVLAVLFDEPIGGHISTVAAGRDGAIELILSTGGGVSLPLEALPDAMQSLARRLCERAARLAPSFSVDSAPKRPAPKKLLISVVFASEVRSVEVWQHSLSDGASPYSDLADDYVSLLSALVKVKRAGIGGPVKK